jgi:light-regulated signal transduction histidine kinase (bacteriophytochrome)
MRMGRLIDDLLAFSRLGRNPIARSTIDMAALVRSVFDDLQAKENSREVELTIQALPPARADRAMIEQVWVNLLSNALKYSSTRPKTMIEIGGRNGGNAPVYFVKDNGVGFDMQYAHKLFGVFQRLHNSAKFEGSGVGLALVDRIVRRHGGCVWAEATEDSGATFYFSLPDLTEAPAQDRVARGP